MDQTNSWRNHPEIALFVRSAVTAAGETKADPLPALYDHLKIGSISATSRLITPVTRNFLHP